MSIESFSGEYRFLSNFWPCLVALDGTLYPSVEHAYQAAKTLDPEERASVRNADGPYKAKKAGRAVILREDWGDVKLDVMADLVYQKFQHPELREKLLATGNQELIEGNHWKDFFWGVCNGKGQNHLGRILMDVRSQLDY